MFGAFSDGLNQYAGYRAYQQLNNLGGGAGGGVSGYTPTVSPSPYPPGLSRA
jgi:hypothetical protein